MWPRWSSHGGNVSLGMGFGVSNTQARPVSLFFLLPADPDVELSATSASGLPA